MSLAPDSVVVRRADALTAEVDEELVMLDPRQGQYFGLDPIARQIWELLETPRSVDALCAEVQGRFDVAPDTCRRDVLAFLDQLDEAELVEVR